MTESRSQQVQILDTESLSSKLAAAAIVPARFLHLSLLPSREENLTSLFGSQHWVWLVCNTVFVFFSFQIELDFFFIRFRIMQIFYKCFVHIILIFFLISQVSYYYYSKWTALQCQCSSCRFCCLECYCLVCCITCHS